MSAPRMLLIKPRWMTRRALADRLASLRREHPGVQLTLLADARPDAEELDWILLPDLWRDPRPQILKTIRQLRRVRYDQAVILTDEHGGDLGSRELRFWALAARAGARRMEGGEPLRFLDPAVLRALAAAPVRKALLLQARLIRPPARPSAARRETLLEGFVYLEHCARHWRPQKGRYLEVDCREGWGVEAAARHGWTAVGLEPEPALAQAARQRGLDVREGGPGSLAGNERFAFIRILADTPHLGDALAPLDQLLEPDGVLLLQVPWEIPEGPPALTPVMFDALEAGTLRTPWGTRLRLAQAGPSLTMGGMVDAWFAPGDGAA